MSLSPNHHNQCYYYRPITTTNVDIVKSPQSLMLQTIFCFLCPEQFWWLTQCPECFCCPTQSQPRWWQLQNTRVSVHAKLDSNEKQRSTKARVDSRMDVRFSIRTRIILGRPISLNQAFTYMCTDETKRDGVQCESKSKCPFKQRSSSSCWSVEYDFCCKIKSSLVRCSY